MRSPYLALPYWPSMCERVFEGLNMSGLPQASETQISESGENGLGTNTFFTNGSEDPWQWATLRKVNNDTQFAKTSHCTDCGHCVEMYTPTPNDPTEVQETRDEIRAWIAGLLGPELSQVQFLN